MRVLYVTAGHTPHDQRFLRAIVGQRHRVWVAAASAPVGRLASELPCGAKPWGLPLQDNVDWNGDIQAQKIDVIHAGPIPSVAATVAKITDAPLVVMSWGSDILLNAATSARERQRAIEALQRANVILGDCRAVIGVIKSWLPQLATPYIQFPWGLDLSRFHELPKKAARDLRSSLHWKGKTVFISTRSWEDIYGVDKLVQAFALVSARLPGTRLLLLSDGSMRERVLGAIAAYGLEDRIHCPGRIDESALPAWFGAADVYVSTAICDGTSVSLLEAMACRLPVVVHDRYGNTEWIANGKNGWLTDCQDVRAIAAGMEQAANSPELWANIGDRNRQDVWEKADWDKNSLRLSEAYELAVERYRLRT